MDRRILYIWLSKIKGIGPVITRNLIEFFKTIDFVYEATYDELIKVEGIGDKLAKIIVENKDLSKSKEIYYKCKRSKIKIITMECSNYPKQLKNFKNAISSSVVSLMQSVTSRLKSFVISSIFSESISARFFIAYSKYCSG